MWRYHCDDHIIDLSEIHSSKSQQRLADELVDIYSTMDFCHFYPARHLTLQALATMSAIESLSHLTQQLLCSFEQGLELPPDTFHRWLQPQSIYNLRLLHYPSDHQRDCSNTFGIAPHCDYGLITLVAQEKVSGVQVRTPCGTD